MIIKIFKFNTMLFEYLLTVGYSFVSLYDYIFLDRNNFKIK